MPSGSPLLTLLARFKQVVLICLQPSKSWSAAAQDRGNDRLVCVCIIALLASLRASHSLVQQLMQGAFQDPLRVGLEGCISGFMLFTGVLMAAYLVRFLAPQFQGTTSQTNALKLVTYSSVPVLLASGMGLLTTGSVLHVSFWAWHAVVWGWSSLLLYKGSLVMTTVARSKRLSFLTSFVASALLLYIVLGSLAIAFTTWATR